MKLPARSCEECDGDFGLERERVKEALNTECVKEALKRDLYMYEKRPTKETNKRDLHRWQLGHTRERVKEAVKRECVKEALKRDLYIHEKRPTKETYIEGDLDLKEKV